GSASKIRLQARDASIADILAALGERFALRYRGTPEGGGMTTTVEGPLRRVVARLLDGYNYVIHSRGDELEGIVLRTGSPYAVAAPMFAPPAVPTNVTRRRAQ